MKKIFHISDIHIRNGNKEVSRYEEYTVVFDNLFTSIKTNIEFYDLGAEDFVIILTGDIFHNKNVVGNYGLELYNKLVKGLTALGHTIIFHGNHDRNQNEISQPSLISSTIEHSNLTILKHTQSFIINNIGFSYVSIDDTLDPLSTSGRKLVLPPFPAIEPRVLKTVALFHGTFGNVRLYNGTEIDNTTNPYPLEWISSFDFALLGDIHLRQSAKYGNVLWGYSGSLVQQNYGEDVVEHGYMIWDLCDNTIENINVYNPRGYINIMIRDDDYIYVRKNGKYLETLCETIEKNADYFPKKIDIRSYSAFTSENTIDLYSILNKYNIEINYFNKKVLAPQLQATKGSLNNNDASLARNRYDPYQDQDVIHINKDTFISYLAKYIPREYYGKAEQIIKKTETLLFDIENCPEELTEECSKKNKEISALINACEACEASEACEACEASEATGSSETRGSREARNSSNAKKAFTIEYLEWKNLYCYEAGNSINFAEALNNTLLICGNNGTGKSAIYDIITLAIWGAITKDKQNTLTKNGIINYKHKTGYVLIDISINQEKYRIRRNFETVKDKTKNTIEVFKYRCKGGGIKNEEISDSIKKNNAANEFIKDKFGTLDEFLTCSMITQVVDNDILRMDYKECTSIIDKASNINEIYELYNLFKVCLNKYNDYMKTIESRKQVYQHIIASSHIDNVIDDELTRQLLLHEEHYISLMKQNNNIAIDEFDSIYKDILAGSAGSASCEDEDAHSADIIDIMSADQYNSKLLRLSEIKNIAGFGSSTVSDIQEYADKYAGIADDTAKPEQCAKPCEFSIIKEERNFLQSYNNPLDINDGTIKTLEYLEERYNNITCEINKLIENKPYCKNVTGVTEMTRDIKAIEREFNTIFNKDSIEETLLLLKQSNLSTQQSYINDSFIDKSNTTISFNSYEELLKVHEGLVKEIETSRHKQSINDAKLMELCKKKNELSESRDNSFCNKPIEKLYDEDYEYNPYEAGEADEADEADEASEADEADEDAETDEYLNMAIAEYEDILNTYYSSLGEIDAVNRGIKKNEEELYAIQNNDEYGYDPCCKYCCNRSWVKRINMLENCILKGYETLDTLNLEVYERDDLDYIYIYNEYTRMSEEVRRRENYRLWQDYNSYVAEDTKVSQAAKDISATLEEIAAENEAYKTNTRLLSEVAQDINKFISDISILYKEYDSAVAYSRYRRWKRRYDSSLEEKNVIEEDIKISKYHSEYETHIKPRKEKLRVLEGKYMAWKKYDTNLKILLAHEYVNLMRDVEKQDAINTARINLEIVKAVKKKRRILEEISVCSENIKRVTADIAKNKMLASYNLKNTTCYNYYKKEYDKIIEVTKVLQIIIDNFKTYRIDLYENHILKNLMIKTNKYIKSLCHEDTKEFGLDFVISETRDIIHINWLIHNGSCSSEGGKGSESSGSSGNKDKQTISINQASGFQRFVISLALRMSLYSNTRTEQIFIDEGFTACDKQNLSLVPGFLKSLLNTFQGVVIVSHIDIIKDSADIIANIEYNSKTKTSHIRYV